MTPLSVGAATETATTAIESIRAQVASELDQQNRPAFRIKGCTTVDELTALHADLQFIFFAAVERVYSNDLAKAMKALDGKKNQGVHHRIRKK